MFGIGVGELFVIFVIAIVVIGPRRLPEVARTMAKLFATAKRTTNELRDQMQQEVRKFQDMEEVKEFKSVVESELYNMKDTTQTYVQREMEEEEERLDNETRDMKQAFTAAVDGIAAEPAELSIAAPAEVPAPAPIAQSAEAPAEAGRSVPGASAYVETHGSDMNADAAPASGSNGKPPGHAQEERTPFPPASVSDKPVT